MFYFPALFLESNDGRLEDHVDHRDVLLDLEEETETVSKSGSTNSSRQRSHRPVYQIDCDSGVSCCDFLTSPVPSRYYDLLGMCCFALSLWLNAHPPKKEFVYVSESQSI